MRKLLITLVLLFIALSSGSAVTPSGGATGICSNCCSWSTDCQPGLKCCDGDVPCSTEPLRYGRCAAVKVCG